MPQTITIDGFGGGINQRLPAVDIADNQVVDSLNMELDGNRSLVARSGLTEWYDKGGTPYAFNSEQILHLTQFKTSDGTTDMLVAATSTKLHHTDVDEDPPIWWSTNYLSGPHTASVRWETAQLNDILILSNMKDPLLKFATSSYDDLGGTPAGDPLSIAVMDDRLFYVDKASPNTLRWSALGNPEDHTTTGKTGTGSWNVGGKEGAGIVRIFPHRGRLFIFKEDQIYTLVPGAPREDSSQWQIPSLVKGIGLAAPDSVQIVKDDIIFLSHAGVVSLTATDQYGDWKQAILSRDIPLLRTWEKASSEYVRSIVHPHKQQYMLAVPQLPLETWPTATWVMDFTEGVSWTRYDGAMAGSAYANVLYQTPKLYVGGDSVVLVEDEDVNQDDVVNFEKLILTKSYTLQEPMKRKLFHRFGVQFEALSDPLSVEIYYRLDQNDLKAKTINYSFAGLLTGAYWDEDLWDVGYWASETVDLTDLIYRLQGGPGRRGQVIDFRFRNDADEKFGLKRMTLRVTLLDTHKFVSE